MKIEFNKLIVFGIFIVWVTSLIASGLKPEIKFILDYTNGAMLSGVIGYTLKSGVENFEKIREWGNPDKEG